MSAVRLLDGKLLPSVASDFRDTILKGDCVAMLDRLPDITD